MKLIIYYLTTDTNNPKELDEIDFLKQIGHVVLVTTTEHKTLINVKQLRLKTYTSLQWNIHMFWMRFCIIFSWMADCTANHDFPERNIYLNSKILTKLINGIWRIKKMKWINKILPVYDILYFAPFRLWQVVKGRHHPLATKVYRRVIVHDSVLVRLGPLTPFVSWARANGLKSIANVKSWDNPLYTQFSTRADGYLVWGESMWHDIRKIQHIKNECVCYWGARQFTRFLATVKAESCQKQEYDLVKPGKILIGYAAAFGDLKMGAYEVELIKSIANYIEEFLPTAILQFRPYPAAPPSMYDPLVTCANITIQNIQGPTHDRFGDGREFVRFGSESERLSYLEHCDCFLSLATTFTIEAAIVGVPIVHLYLESDSRKSIAEQQVFRRIDISYHIMKYYKDTLYTANNYKDLIEKLLFSVTKRNECLVHGGILLEKLGITSLSSESREISNNVSKMLFLAAHS